MTTTSTIEQKTVVYGKRARKVHTWDRDPHDFYVDPIWCSERLFEEESFIGPVWDPACGTGRIVAAARAAGLSAIGTDIVARGFPGAEVVDFLTTKGSIDNIVTNPPFKLAQKFVEHALRSVSRKAAFLLPLGWLNGDKRSRWLEDLPLQTVLIITPRPSMPPGELVAADIKPQNGRQDFAWYIFAQGYDGKPELGWLRREG